MSERPPVADLLAALSELLRDLGIRWYLFGAQAVAIWGRPRMSADVDVTAEIDPSRVPEFLDAMAERGFELRIGSGVEEFVARTRVLPFLHLPTRQPLDVVLAGPGLEEAFLDRAEKVDLGGVVVPVISAEDLVVTKVLAGRPKDLEDLGGILRERGTALDLDRVRTTLGQLEEALGHSDLLPTFESELARR